MSIVLVQLSGLLRVLVERLFAVRVLPMLGHARRRRKREIAGRRAEVPTDVRAVHRAEKTLMR